MKSIKWEKTGFILTFVIIAALNTAFAGEVQDRVNIQENRIDQGVKSGELTPKEAGRLETNEARIEANRKKALSDGKMTAKERRRLRRQENRQSRKIHRAKHNAEVSKQDQ